MKYSPLAVHCTSLCFDVIQKSSFKSMTRTDIEGFRSDIYLLIRERTSLLPTRHKREHLFLCHVTDGVIRVLQQCLNNPEARDSVWILAALESRINISIKTILH
ncbi:hypothetical protein P7F88_04400 [Vibrio hannami]|uniref:hypothetical protein n=1 Tax=Vibrio hannami TaxID=2717094 RepID=UPI00240F6F94|nr:hypothetical protein [Vibrio hannami]MDG3085384.1 hypothetical protein [Vibrio hannami]